MLLTRANQRTQASPSSQTRNEQWLPWPRGQLVAFDAGCTAQPIAAATATNSTAETIPITRRGDGGMAGWRVGGC